MRVLAVVGWKEYQHYKKRDPIWIKLYQKTLTTEVWVLGNDVSRLVQLASTLLAARYDNQIPMKWDLIRKVAHFGFTETEFDAAIQHLITFDFLEIQEVDDPVKATASKPLATCDTTSPTMLAQSRGRVEAETDQEGENASVMLARREPDATDSGGESPSLEPPGTSPPRARPRIAVDDSTDPLPWLRIRASYPAGTYEDHDFGNAEKFARLRVDEGFTWGELEAGVERLAAQKRTTGKIGSQYIWSPARFFGPDPDAPGRFVFQREFKLPVQAEKPNTERDARLAREAGELVALSDGRAARGLLDCRDPTQHDTPSTYASFLRAEELNRRGRPAGELTDLVTDLAARKRVAT